MPDFGIMRGFNDKLFGDKLYAGQLPTQLGLIGSSDFGTDPDAQAFFDRVTAAGGSLTTTEKAAVNTLVVTMKADGIWSLMKAIYPMVGASAAACSRNLKADEFNGSFSAGWTFASTGVTPNGTSAYMNTNFIPSVNLSQNSKHISSYTRTNINNTLIGAASQVIPPTTHDQIVLVPGVGLFANLSSEFGFTAYSPNNGFYLTRRINSTTSNTFRNNTLIFTDNLTSNNNVSINLYIGARNGGPDFYSNSQIAFSSIGDGLTDTQASNFYTAVQAFQTTLARNV